MILTEAPSRPSLDEMVQFVVREPVRGATKIEHEIYWDKVNPRYIVSQKVLGVALALILDEGMNRMIRKQNQDYPNDLPNIDVWLQRVQCEWVDRRTSWPLKLSLGETSIKIPVDLESAIRDIDYLVQRARAQNPNRAKETTYSEIYDQFRKRTPMLEKVRIILNLIIDHSIAVKVADGSLKGGAMWQELAQDLSSSLIGRIEELGESDEEGIKTELVTHRSPHQSDEESQEKEVAARTVRDDSNASEKRDSSSAE